MIKLLLIDEIVRGEFGMNEEKINIFDNKDFKKRYKSASYELTREGTDNKFFYDLLIETYNDKEQMKFIKMANDYFQFAPVYSWLMFNKDRIKDHYDPDGKLKIEDIKISSELKKAIGAFWGWVMQYDIKNNKSIKNKKVYKQNPVKQSLKRKNTFDFKTATLYDIDK